MHRTRQGRSTSVRCFCLPRPAVLGGGIERYVQTVQSAFDDAGVTSLRLDLTRPGLPGTGRCSSEGTAALAAMAGPVRIVIAHRALLPVATVASPEATGRRHLGDLPRQRRLGHHGGLRGTGSRAG